MKWEAGFTCRKCNNDKYYKGEKPFSRRCIKCKNDENPTINTKFEKLKFSILKAFQIVFKIGTKKKGMSSLELSHEFELRQKTCWAYKQKIQEVMKSSLKSPLTGIVHVDEFVIGGPEEGKKERGQGLKKLIVLAIEILDNGVGRAYAEVINRSSAKEIGGFLEKYVSKDAEIITDKWKGYTPLKKEFLKLYQL